MAKISNFIDESLKISITKLVTYKKLNKNYGLIGQNSYEQRAKMGRVKLAQFYSSLKFYNLTLQKFRLKCADPSDSTSITNSSHKGGRIHTKEINCEANHEMK